MLIKQNAYGIKTAVLSKSARNKRHEAADVKVAMN
jgi:hypothetical protein